MSDLRIKIDAGSTEETSIARATGRLKHIITDEERVTFGILDRDLKRKVRAYYGKKPKGAYVRGPTPWNDLYKRYSWDQIETVLTPIDAKIISVATEPTILSKTDFKNESNKKGTFSGRLSKQVSNTVGTSWSESKTLSFNQEIKYDIGFLGTGGSGSSSFGFQKQWGKSTAISQATTIGTEAGFSVDLDPGEEVVAELSANSGKMKVTITYEARLTGLAAVNYSPIYKGHQFYGIPISEVLGDSNSVKITEDIEIGYYDEAHVIIKHPAGTTLKSERELDVISTNFQISAENPYY